MLEREVQQHSCDVEAVTSQSIANENASSSEDGDEDYMSDKYTSNTADIRPGIAIGHSQRRWLKVENERVENEERLRSAPKRAELEKQMRDTALSKPISNESKGFALLAKMGYKPGMSLGKKKEGSDEGIKEPIAVDFKTCRTGLGHKTQEEEMRKQRNEIIRKRLAARMKTNQYLIGDFRNRQRMASMQKQLIGDIVKSRKACQDLDLRNGLELPLNPYFWPIYKVKKDDGPSSSKRIHTIDDGRSSPDQFDDDFDDDYIFKYPNGKTAPAEPELNQLCESDLTDRLEDVTKYLRERHNYCVWCGCQYDSMEQLSQECAGPTRADHEGSDNDNDD